MNKDMLIRILQVADRARVPYVRLGHVERVEKCALCKGALDVSSTFCSPVGELCYDCWSKRYNSVGLCELDKDVI